MALIVDVLMLGVLVAVGVLARNRTKLATCEAANVRRLEDEVALYDYEARRRQARITELERELSCHSQALARIMAPGAAQQRSAAAHACPRRQSFHRDG